MLRVVLPIGIVIVLLIFDSFMYPWLRMRLDASLLNLPAGYELVKEVRRGDALTPFASDLPRLTRAYVTDDSAAEACAELRPLLEDWLNRGPISALDDTGGVEECYYRSSGRAPRFGTYLVIVRVFPAGSSVGGKRRHPPRPSSCHCSSRRREPHRPEADLGLKLGCNSDCISDAI